MPLRDFAKASRELAATLRDLAKASRDFAATLRVHAKASRQGPAAGINGRKRRCRKIKRNLFVYNKGVFVL
jgi:hypothetical protein